MQIVKSIADLRRAVSEAKNHGRRVGLVPTMGALHAGHMSLVESSKNAGDFTVVSIFVNPTQFGPSEDLERYPRPFEADAQKCEAAGVDVIFHPSVLEMYTTGFATYVDVEGITSLWEGKARPGHFRGVTTVCLKLFTATEPDCVYFGMKDYQQLKVIEKMVRDLNLNLDVVAVPTVREPDGLAMSSRNVYLNAEERRAALVLFKSLTLAQTLVEGGERTGDVIRQSVAGAIAEEPLALVDYLAVVDPDTLAPIETIEKQVLVALAVKIGNTRLIDNALISTSEGT